jgi:hypothetical protein
MLPEPELRSRDQQATVPSSSNLCSALVCLTRRMSLALQTNIIKFNSRSLRSGLGIGATALASVWPLVRNPARGKDRKPLPCALILRRPDRSPHCSKRPENWIARRAKTAGMCIASHTRHADVHWPAHRRVVLVAMAQSRPCRRSAQRSKTTAGYRRVKIVSAPWRELVDLRRSGAFHPDGFVLATGASRLPPGDATRISLKAVSARTCSAS